MSINKKRSLESMKAVFAPAEPTKREFTSSYYPFWNMQVGEKCVIRFIPDKNDDNKAGFLLEKSVHKFEINGKEVTIPCNSMYGDSCDICKKSAELYKVGDEVRGKTLYKKRQNLGQCLIVEDPLPKNEETGESHEGKLRHITIAYQLYNLIKESMSSGELDSWPDDITDGYDFIIKKTMQGQYATYILGSKFANRSRALTEAELIEVEANQIDLSTLLPKQYPADKMQAMLDAYLNGTDYDDDKVGFDNAKPQSTPKTNSVSSTSSTASSVDNEENTAQVDDMLAQIRARRAAATKSE